MPQGKQILFLKFHFILILFKTFVPIFESRSLLRKNIWIID